MVVTDKKPIFIESYIMNSQIKFTFETEIKVPCYKIHTEIKKIRIHYKIQGYKRHYCTTHIRIIEHILCCTINILIEELITCCIVHIETEEIVLHVCCTIHIKMYYVVQLILR